MSEAPTTAGKPRYIRFVERLRMPRVLARPGPSQLVVDGSTMGRVEVDADACTGCRMCVRVCPAATLEMAGEHDVRMVGDFAACIACGDCVAVCAPDAIVVTRPLRYEGFYKTIGRGPLSAPRLF